MTPTAGRIAAAALLPPFGIYLEEGAGRPFHIACGLTMLGFVPGAAYALWRLFRRPSRAAA
ncbi:YqaE/Pmp3 family membrane protein [Sphingomonas pituitosa]|uniref:YqaE/Pmp3 family membrane protein n=1 Tax=Sphingomonas pituitosa TaxID=99597 RepID=UPI00083600AB|nr:YqaE/Pmp3 family membrane protein [Sphingomonas pituitosa]